MICSEWPFERQGMNKNENASLTGVLGRNAQRSPAKTFPSLQVRTSSLRVVCPMEPTVDKRQLLAITVRMGAHPWEKSGPYSCGNGIIVKPYLDLQCSNDK